MFYHVRGVCGACVCDRGHACGDRGIHLQDKNPCDISTSLIVNKNNAGSDN